MNEFDKINLNFIINASKQDLAEFYDRCDADDFKYIRDLITKEISRLRILELEHFDDIEVTQEANSILEKFMITN